MYNNDLHQAYRTFFGKGDALYQLFAPYRICPLGAHVDHQHGLVSGFAFDSGIEFLFSATDNGKVEMASLSFEGLMRSMYSDQSMRNKATGATICGEPSGRCNRISGLTKEYVELSKVLCL